MITYLTVYLGAMAMAVLATPVVGRIARAIGAVDTPGPRKVHKQAVPRIGGAAIIFAMLASTIPALIFDDSIRRALAGFELQLVCLLSAGLFVFVVGLVDDLRGMKARAKLLAQLLAALAICLSGIRIDRIAVVSWFSLELGWLAWPVTILWVVGITNAVNLIDGLDGLAAGISAVVCGVIAILALYGNQIVMAALMLALMGALTGFLVFNFNPARVFMGDCGSMFLGFTLAASSVMCATKSQTIVGLALPTLALGVPIFDTLFTMLRRFLERRGVMSPDRSHLHHRLLDMGLRQRHVVLLLYAITVLAAGLGMFMMITRDAGTIVIFGCVLFLLVTVFRFVGSVSLRETVKALRRNRAIAHQVREHQIGFEHSRLRIRQATSFDDWWQAVCAAAEEIDIARMRLKLTNRSGMTRTLVWQSPTHSGNGDELVSMKVPLRHRRSGPPLNIDMDVPANGSLESAGMRTALFGRLIDENSLASLAGQGERPPYE